MAFETSKEVLEWYEKQERTLTDEEINGIMAGVSEALVKAGFLVR